MKKVPLPPALPLQTRNMFVLGDSSRQSYYRPFNWLAPKSDDEPLPPPPEQPVFSESIDEVRKNADALVAPLKFCETLSRPHEATIRLLNGDERRVNRDRFSILDSELPRFAHPSGKQILTALNRLFHSWTSLGAEVHVDGQVNQTISVWILGERLPLGFVDYGWKGAKIKPHVKRQGKFGLFWAHLYDDRRFPQDIETYREYDDFSPNVLGGIIVESILVAEQHLRSEKQREYEYVLKRREEVVRQREERRLAEIRRRQVEQRQMVQKRLDLLSEAEQNIAAADRLRGLVQSFDQTVESAGRSIEGYDHWREWTTRQADKTDPRTMSANEIERWISQFDLSPRPGARLEFLKDVPCPHHTGEGLLGDPFFSLKDLEN